MTKFFNDSLTDAASVFLSSLNICTLVCRQLSRDRNGTCGVFVESPVRTPFILATIIAPFRETVMNSNSEGVSRSELDFVSSSNLQRATTSRLSFVPISVILSRGGMSLSLR